MILRSIVNEDFDKLNEIKGYEGQEEIRNDSNTITGAIVEDIEGKIISGGVIRNISEIVLVTDRNFHSRKRLDALDELLKFGVYASIKMDRHDLHAFVQDKKFSEILIKKFGFKEAIGRCLVKIF